MTASERSSTYRRASHTAWRDLGDELVLLDLAGKQMYGLNPIAGYLWRAFDGETDIDRLLERLAGDGLSLDREETGRFCSELVDLGLLEKGGLPREDASAPPHLPENQDPPRIIWCEPVRQAAATCAFVPGQNPLCTQVPFV